MHGGPKLLEAGVEACCPGTIHRNQEIKVLRISGLSVESHGDATDDEVSNPRAV